MWINREGAAVTPGISTECSRGGAAGGILCPIPGSGVTLPGSDVSLGFKVSVAEDDDSLSFLPPSACLFHGFRFFHEAQLTGASP